MFAMGYARFLMMSERNACTIFTREKCMRRYLGKRANNRLETDLRTRSQSSRTVPAQPWRYAHELMIQSWWTDNCLIH